jgi:hypothetical protein
MMGESHSSGFHMSSRHRKEQAAAGQKAEMDHILDPEFKSVSNFSMDDTQPGPSKRNQRTAGGLLHGPTSLRAASSLSNFKASGNKKSQLGGVYTDAEGKVHDTEFDPFAGISEMTRNKSRRRSAFGSERRKGSDSGSSVSEDSIEKEKSPSRPEANGHREELEARRRRESEKKRFEEVSEHAMMRRRSVLSQRSAQSGKAPSLRSTEDGPMSANLSYHLERLNARSKSSQGSVHRSPLSPTFGHSPSSPLPTVADSDERPEKSTETTSMPPPPIPKAKVEFKPSGTVKVTGFDAPPSPMPAQPQSTPRSNTLSAPSPARMSTSSHASRTSSETGREGRTRPPERPREELFPETPAQQKKREEKERRQARSGYSGPSNSGRLVAGGNRAVSSGSRVLPEIEILADDDPRVVIPAQGPSTRVQTKYTQADHVIRPFANLDRPSSLRSVTLAGSGTKAPSEILDEGQGGYVPTRWAKGDKLLRVTEDEKEKYRPKEWGGRTGDLAGKPEEWR